MEGNIPKYRVRRIEGFWTNTTAKIVESEKTHGDVQELFFVGHTKACRVPGPRAWGLGSKILPNTVLLEATSELSPCRLS